MSLFAADVERPHVPGELRQASEFHRASRGDPSRREALSLLGEVLARLPDVERPVVQIVAGGPDCGPSHVGFDLSVAAASHFGRTLLVSATHNESANLADARELSWKMTALMGSEPDTVIPDAVVAGLYHTQPVASIFSNQSLPVTRWLDAKQDFRMVVLDSPAIATHPQTLTTAKLCSGCVVTVEAGVTRLDDLRATERQLASAGVRVLGTVLHEAPSIRMLAPRRRRAV